MKNEAAAVLDVEMEAEAPERVKSAAAELGRRGGKKRAENMTPVQRSESARKAIKARWEREDHFSDDKARELLRLALPMAR